MNKAGTTANPSLTVNAGATLRNSLVENVPAEEGENNDVGGAIWLRSGATLTMNGTIEDCSATSGGGIYAENGSGALTIGGTITGCSATDGGGIHAGTGRSITVNSGALFTENEASNDGGAIYSSANVTVSGGTFGGEGVGNTATGDGGAIYLGSAATFTMSAGNFIDNESTGGNGGALAVQNTVRINGGSFTENKALSSEEGQGRGGAISATNGAAMTIPGTANTITFEANQANQGGAVYVSGEGSTVRIEGAATSFSGNHAEQGGAIFDQSTVTMSAGTMTGNYATNKGGAVYVAGRKTFTMSGGTIGGTAEGSANYSPQGAIGTGSGGILNFSGNAVVTGNTNASVSDGVVTAGTTAMNVYLGYADTAIINTTGFGSDANIGVYVANGNQEEGEGGADKPIYYDHGIAGRIFGTYTGARAASANLDKFINDREDHGVTLTGVPGATIDGGNTVMWQGMPLKLVVTEYGSDPLVFIPGIAFSLTNAEGVVVWTGISDENGLITVPWGVAETEGGNAASFAYNNSYELKQTATVGDYVLPAGSWTVTIGRDNSLTWVTNTSEEAVNRTLPIDTELGSLGIDMVFPLHNDVKPTITFDGNGTTDHPAMLSDGSPSREDTVNFTTTETSHEYVIEEINPTRSGYVFVSWNTVQTPTEEEPGTVYNRNDTITFYRHTDNDDITLYAQWAPVVAKITDRNDNLLYVDGAPAVYMTLADAFTAFNSASFKTAADGTATQRKIKLLVPSYEMTQPVTLARGKTAVLTTAASRDGDGYPGPYTGADSSVCVITRGYDTDSNGDGEPDTVSASMITNNYNLTLMNITLDGRNWEISGNGGIVDVEGSYSQLTVAEGATLRNSTVTGNGGAIYAAASTTVNLSGGSITGNNAANGGAVYALGTVNVTGSDISDNEASGQGGGLYVGETGAMTMSGGNIGGESSANTAAQGAGMYLAGTGRFTGGTIAYNEANTAGGGVYATADVTLSGATLSNNSAGNTTTAGNGGGMYMSSGKLTVSTGTIRANSANAVGDEGGLGGGMYVGNGASIAMTGGNIGTSENANTAASGAGVYLAADSGASTFTGGTIAYNAATKAGGGLYTAVDVELSGVNVANNGANNGAGVYVNGTEEKTTALTLSSGNIRANTATTSGGGVYVDVYGRFEMKGGTIGGSTNSYRNEAVNGAGVYLAGGGITTYATMTMSSGILTNNRASGLGGAVYAENYAQMNMSGGSISLNRANGTNGGAINVEGANSRLFFSDEPVIFNNPASAATTAQKNVVLSEDYNTVINTDETGLTGGTIGVYVVDTATTDSSTIYNKHGLYNKPFGTFNGDENENRDNAMYFRNDRNMALYGMPNDEDPGTVYWLNVVCKLTNSSDSLLYERKTVNGVTAYYPAVYDSLRGGFTVAESEPLYRKSGSAYIAYNGALKLKMLQDYELNNTEMNVSYSGSRALTFTTAETSITSTMSRSGDVYIFTPSSDGETSRATITRGFDDVGSMFVTNANVTVQNLVLDGNNQYNSSKETDYVEGLSQESHQYGGIFTVTGGTLNISTDAVLTKGKARAGGAIYVTGGTVNISRGTVTENTAVNGGGAVYAASGVVNVNGGTITDNSTTESGSHGGAIFLANTAQATISSGSVTNNTTITGGAVYAESSAAVRMTGGTISGNSATAATSYGGAIFVTGNAQATVSGGTISGHTTTQGGAIYEEGTSAVTVSGSASINSNTATLGGAIFATAKSSVTISGGTISESTATNGGAVYLESASSFSMSGGKIENNRATGEETDTGNGGGVYNGSTGTITLSGGTISGNTASSSGGGMYVSSGANLAMSSGSVNGNTAVLGGGIYVATNSDSNALSTDTNVTLNITGGEVSENTATTNGGGCYIGLSRKAMISNVTMSGNQATAATNELRTSVAEEVNGCGGAIYVDEAAQLNISNSTIGEQGKPNNAYKFGGGIYVFSHKSHGRYSQAGKLNMSGSTVSYNSAAFGGGIGCNQQSVLVVSNTEISHNEAITRGNPPAGTTIYSGSNGRGGGIAVQGGTGRMLITGGKLEYNTASVDGGGIFTMSNKDISAVTDFTELESKNPILTNEGGVSIIDGTEINHNNALSGGGGYANCVTLRNATVAFNATTTTTISSGAGFYVDGTLTLGKAGETDTTTITGNTASNGDASDLALWRNNSVVSYNRANAINLAGTFKGEILVSNPGEAFTTCGITTGEDNPEDKASGATDFEKHRIRSQDGSELYVRPDPDDLTKLIWWKQPVCKITDDEGNRIDFTINGTDVEMKGVFASIEDANDVIYKNDQVTYHYTDGQIAPRPTQIQMIVAEYVLPETERTLGGGYSPMPPTLTLTTAAAGDGAFDFPKDAVDSDDSSRTVPRSRIISNVKENSENGYGLFKPGNNAFTVKNVIIDGNYQEGVTGVVNRIINLNGTGTVTLSDGALLINGYDFSSSKKNGGAILMEGGTLVIEEGAEIRNSTANNGGAVYMAAGTLTMTGGKLTGNSATNGGAVYVAAGATMELKDGSKTENGTTTTTSATISGNTVRTTSGNTVTGDVDVNKGAGIYLAQNATLNLEGTLSFDSNNLTDTTGTYSSKTNGQDEVYTNGVVRQDIFIAGYGSEDAASVVVTGALGAVDAETSEFVGNPGAIWVWAEQPKHYEMLEQFAVFDNALVSGDEIVFSDEDSDDMTKTKLEATFLAFRNAQDDEKTGCGGEYLTGQAGEVLRNIYWTGGFDFLFRKIDGDGKAIGKTTDGSDGATFTLYLAAAKDGKLVPVEAGTKDTPLDVLNTTELNTSEWAAYQQPDKVTKIKGPATATSKKINAADAVTIKAFADVDEKPEDKDVYGEGLAVFEKIPPGNYFMVETGEPDPWKALYDLYRVYVDGTGWISVTAVETNTDGKYAWPDAVDPTSPADKPTTKFVKDDDDRYSWAETVPDGAETTDIYNIVNVSKLSRKVILRKVDGEAFTPLKGAEFTVYFADKQTIVKDADKVELKDKSSGAGGAFWIGKLPYGTYYLHEMKNASGSVVDIWFTLTVNEEGVGYLQEGDEEGTDKILNKLEPVDE